MVMSRLLAIGKTVGICGYIWLPFILFLAATTSVFFTITPSGCSPKVLKGFLPAPAREVYGITNVTSWYFTNQWDVYPTRGVCPYSTATTTTSANNPNQKGKQVQGATPPRIVADCLKWSPNTAWQIIDKYNVAAGVSLPMTMATSANNFTSAYNAMLAAVAIAAFMGGVACINLFLSLNSPTGRHGMFSLFLLLEILSYYVIVLLAIIAVASAATSSIVMPAAWGQWFPSCTVVVVERDVPGIIYWLIFMGALLLGSLLVGEATHKWCSKCLTRKVAIEGTVSNDETGFDGGPFGSSGFTKVCADWRVRVLRLAFFGQSGSTFVMQGPAVENSLRGDGDAIPRPAPVHDEVPKGPPRL